MLLPMLVLVAAEAATPWVLSTDEATLKIWYRDLPDGSGREIKAETLIPAPPARLWAVLQYTDHYVEFMPYLEELRVLETFDGGRIQYERLNPPVISQRDYVVEVRTEADETQGRYRLSWKALTDKGPPPTEGIVRITVNQGAFSLEPAEGGVKLSYRLFTHPGGSIPAWIARRANTSSVPDLFKALRGRTLDPAWKRD